MDVTLRWRTERPGQVGQELRTISAVDAAPYVETDLRGGVTLGWTQDASGFQLSLDRAEAVDLATRILTEAHRFGVLGGV